MTARRRRACAHAPKRCRPCCRRLPKADETEREPTMLRLQRLIAASVLVALSSALAGCGSMGNWDPTDLLDFLDTKKKLPGERKPVFPQGVPGLEQGVPRELYKGANQQQETPAVAAVQPVEQPKSRNTKGKGKQLATAPAQDAAPAAAPEAAPEEEGSTAAAPPAP